MNSLIFYYLFLFFPGVLVCASNYVKYIVKTPHQFKYEISDVLNIDIVMINIPPNVNSYSVYAGKKCIVNKSKISNWDEWHSKMKGIAMQNAHDFVQLLLYGSYHSYLCTTVDIARGQPKDDHALRSKQNDTDFCLNDKNCTIVVDFRRSCSDIIPYFNCSVMRRLVVCTKQEHKEATFTWQQFYDDGSYTGTTPEIKATISKFSFHLEYFDNNTFVKALPGNSISNKIIVNPNIIPYYKDTSKMTYTDSTDIVFDCEKYLKKTKYVYVGLINTTKNKITTLNTTKINQKYGEEFNGSILCCLCYMTTEQYYVRRFVRNKKLFIYSTEALDDFRFIRNLTVPYTYIYVTAPVLILAVAIIIAIRKFCCNKTSEPKPAPRKRWEPFYLNMLFRKECDKEIEAQRQAQEPQYEEITEKKTSKCYITNKYKENKNVKGKGIN